SVRAPRRRCAARGWRGYGRRFWLAWLLWSSLEWGYCIGVRRSGEVPRELMSHKKCGPRAAFVLLGIRHRSALAGFLENPVHGLILVALGRRFAARQFRRLLRRLLGGLLLGGALLRDRNFGIEAGGHD